MNVLNSYSKGLAILALLLVVAGLLMAACGSSKSDVGSAAQNIDEVDSSETIGKTEASTDVDDSNAAIVEPSVEEGSDVGQRVPAFYIRDASAAKITSEELFSKGRPSFFYFFTTW